MNKKIIHIIHLIIKLYSSISIIIVILYNKLIKYKFVISLIKEKKRIRNTKTKFITIKWKIETKARKIHR